MTMLFEPAMVMSYGPPASKGPSVARQAPCGSATTRLALSVKLNFDFLVLIRPTPN